MSTMVNHDDLVESKIHQDLLEDQLAEDDEKAKLYPVSYGLHNLEDEVEYHYYRIEEMLSSSKEDIEHATKMLTEMRLRLVEMQEMVDHLNYTKE